MSEPTADHVAIEVAGKATGIPARTLRHWVASGKLAAIAGKRGKLVSMREVARLAELVGKPDGKSQPPPGNPATVAGHLAEPVAEPVADAALVSDAARQQLASIRDEWLAPLVAQITDQAERIGRLEAERDRLRAEVEALRSQASPAPPHEATPPSGHAATPAPPAPARGVMRWVRRVLLGEE